VAFIPVFSVENSRSAVFGFARNRTSLSKCAKIAFLIKFADETQNGWLLFNSVGLLQKPNVRRSKISPISATNAAKAKINHTVPGFGGHVPDKAPPATIRWCRRSVPG
jgi:hypothetical protein